MIDGKQKRRGARLMMIAGALCLAVTVSAWADALSKAESVLKSGMKTRNAEKIGAGLQALAAVGGEKAMRSALKSFGKLKRALDGQTYWQVVGGLAAFRDDAALTELGDYLVKKKKRPETADILFALQNNASSSVIKVHEQIVDKGSFKQKLMTVDQLALIKSPIAGDLLIKVLETEESAQLRERTMNALAALTGQSQDGAENWIGWWKANRDKDPLSGPGETEGLGSVTRDGARGGEIGTLEKLGDKVIVIESQCCVKAGDHNFDHIDRILGDININCKVVTKKEFAKFKPADIADVMAILVNCSQLKEHCICPTCKVGGARNFRMGQCVGCDKHNFAKDELSAGSVQLIKAFVERGGYLFSEDWGLVEILQKAWPKIVGTGAYIRQAGKVAAGGGVQLMTCPKCKRTYSQPPKDGKCPDDSKKLEIRGREQVELKHGDEVMVTPAPGMAAHNYMRGVFLKPRGQRVDKPIEGGTKERGQIGSEFKGPEHKWTIDDDSPAVSINDPRRVQVLMRSAELDALTKGLGTVALTFHVGRGKPKDIGGKREATGGGSKAAREVATEERLPGGRVLHVLSHFGKQRSQSDELAMRNLLVNFMLECARRHGFAK